MIVVVFSVLALLGWGVFWLVRDARRQARNCDEYYRCLRESAVRIAAPEPVSLRWDAVDDRQLARLLETGER